MEWGANKSVIREDIAVLLITGVTIGQMAVIRPVLYADLVFVTEVFNVVGAEQIDAAVPLDLH